MVDFALQRLNMVESQVRPSELTDRRIANAMMAVARENYLPKVLHGVAYSDAELGLGSIEGADASRQLLAPRTIALMLQTLDVEGDDVVLLVGAGTGYEAALLARMVQTVVAVEDDEALMAWSESALARDDVSNAVVVRGPLAVGYAAEGPFDAILVNGGVDQVPMELLDQLKDGGRLVAVRHGNGVSRLVRWARAAEHFPALEQAAAAAAVLPGFKNEAVFQF